MKVFFPSSTEGLVKGRCTGRVDYCALNLSSTRAEGRGPCLIQS